MTWEPPGQIACANCGQPIRDDRRSPTGLGTPRVHAATFPMARA